MLDNPNPQVFAPDAPRAPAAPYSLALSAEEVFDYIRDIKDPEHPHTLEELKVVSLALVKVTAPSDGLASTRIWISFTPTVPHCSLAATIGLFLRVKLERVLDEPFKLDLQVTKGSHSTEEDINKRINDKERAQAAIENPTMLQLVERCLA